MARETKPGVFRFDIIRKLSRPRSYMIARQYRMDMLSILSQTFSRIVGGKP
ncbi:MAG: hypothetical protein AB1657_04385 [Candidatus Micrarchaeota archaeon]